MARILHYCGWYRPVATAPIRPLVWEPPCAVGAALEKAKRLKKKIVMAHYVLVSCEKEEREKSSI